MDRYVALVDVSPDGYGAQFPDLPGCVAMGDTLDELWSNSAEALAAWVREYEIEGRAVPYARDLKVMFDDDDAQAAIRDSAVTQLTCAVSKRT